MYGLPYDDIKQRHREQKIKTVAAVSGICAGVFFIFGMVCMGLTIKINSQKKYIEQQQEQLQEQYREEQVKYAESMSVVSDTLLKEGRMIDAVYAARIAMPSSLEDESLPYLVSTEYALSNALGQYEQDVYVPYDTEPLDKNDDAWSYDGSYSFLDMYMSGFTIIYSYPLDEDRILVFTSDSKTYVYNNSDKTILEATTNTFSQPPSGYLTAAYINDDKLYMWFTHADYVSVYKYRKPDKNNLTGYTNSREVYARNGHMLEEGEEVLSDDGKYKLLVGPNRTIIISNAKNDKVVKRLYDLRGTIYGLDRLGNKNAYILRVSGKYSYLLNEDFDIKARIPFYYGYEDDGDTLLTYVFLSNKKDVIDGKNMEIYRQPLATYEDLIEEADDLIDGFELSEEIKDRYKMLK
jgi:hypothetical protein